MTNANNAALEAVQVEPVAHCFVKPLEPNEWQRKYNIMWVKEPVTGPLYTTPQEPAVNAWLPIDSAPKDGTHVQLYRPEIQFTGYYGGADSGWRINAPGLPAMWPCPTLWMPIPAAPKEAS